MRKYDPDGRTAGKPSRTPPPTLRQVTPPTASSVIVLKPATLRHLPGSARSSPAARGKMIAGSFFRPGPRTLSASSAALTHDARNLISAVGLYCELLRGPGVLAPEYRHYADDLERVGETGARLIEALIAPAEPLPGAPSAGGGISDVGAEVSAMRGTLHALAGPAIRLEVECLPCAGQVALHSQDLLRILLNLVQNAREALERASAPRPGMLRITVQPGPENDFLSRSRPPSDRRVVLSVRDNGPGIPAEDLPHIFAAGYSGRSRNGVRWMDGAAPSPSHCGLGLSIVRHLVEAAGGEVRAISAPGLGTRFDIELPMLPSPALSARLVSPGKRAGKIS